MFLRPSWRPNNLNCGAVGSRRRCYYGVVLSSYSSSSLSPAPRRFQGGSAGCCPIPSPIQHPCFGSMTAATATTMSPIITTTRPMMINNKNNDYYHRTIIRWHTSRKRQQRPKAVSRHIQKMKEARTSSAAAVSSASSKNSNSQNKSSSRNRAFPNTYQPHANPNKKQQPAAQQTKNDPIATTTTTTTTNKKQKLEPFQFPPPVDHPPNVAAIVTCHPGLEGVLSQELTQLGIPHVSPFGSNHDGDENENDDDNTSSSSSSSTTNAWKDQRRHMQQDRWRRRTSNHNQELRRSILLDHNSYIALLPPITMETIWKCHLYLGSASQVLVPLIMGKYNNDNNDNHHNKNNNKNNEKEKSNNNSKNFDKTNHKNPQRTPQWGERCRALGELQRKVADFPWASLVLPRRQRTMKYVPITTTPTTTDGDSDNDNDTPNTPNDSNNNNDHRDWKLVYDPDSDGILYCHIHARSVKSRVYHTGAIQERIIWAINESLGFDYEAHGYDPQNYSQYQKKGKGRFDDDDKEGPEFLPPVALYRGGTESQQRGGGDDEAVQENEIEWEDLEDGAKNNHKDNDTTSLQQQQQPQYKDGKNILSLVIQFQEDHFQLWLNTTAALSPLHRRGYRLDGAKAPLREDLAYAMLYSAGWVPEYDGGTEINLKKKKKKKKKKQQKKKGGVLLQNDDERMEEENEEEESSHANDGDPSRTDDKTTNLSQKKEKKNKAFVDPFCGSGTLAIEAAAMKLGLPPGRLRPPPLAGTHWFHPGQWDRIITQQQQQQQDQQQYLKQQHASTTSQPPSLIVSCSDRCEGVRKTVHANAQRAGVWNALQFQTCPISGHPWFRKLKKQQQQQQQQLKKNTNDVHLEEEGHVRSHDDDNDDDDDPEQQEQTPPSPSLPSLDYLAQHDYEVFLVTNPPLGERIPHRANAKAAAAAARPNHNHDGSTTKKPWGVRKMEQILPLFQTISTRFLHPLDVFNIPYTTAILTNNEHLIKRAGMRFAESHLTFRHGRLRVTNMVSTSTTTTSHNNSNGMIPSSSSSWLGHGTTTTVNHDDTAIQHHVNHNDNNDDGTRMQNTFDSTAIYGMESDHYSILLEYNEYRNETRAIQALE